MAAAEAIAQAKIKEAMLAEAEVASAESKAKADDVVTKAVEVVTKAVETPKDGRLRRATGRLHSHLRLGPSLVLVADDR